VIIGSDLAQQEFGGSRNVLGKTIRLDDENYTVIGVMPRASSSSRRARCTTLGDHGP